MAFDAQSLFDQLDEYIGDVDPSSRKGKRRLAILEAATARFKEQGYKATSMDDIAADVGVAKGTLYLYFPKKIDLVIACSALEKREWMPRFLTILDPSTGTAAARLKQWIVLILTLPSESLTMRLLDDDLGEIVAEMPAELLSQGEANLAEIFGPLLSEAAGDHRWSEREILDRAQVFQALAYLGPTLRHDFNHPGMTVKRFAGLLADLFVDGLRARPAEHAPASPASPPSPAEGSDSQ